MQQADRVPGDSGSAAAILKDARERDRLGQVAEAMAGYAAAIEIGRSTGDCRIVSEANRSLSVLHHCRNERELARAVCQASYDEAVGIGDSLLQAQALNVQASMAFEAGDLRAARVLYHQALASATPDPTLVARIEQNLGILSNIEGDFPHALVHYQDSLAAFERAGDDHGRAIAHHNLGMLNADQALWDAADQHFRDSLALAKQTNALHLQGLCFLNHTEVHVARGQYEAAQLCAQLALEIFDRLESELDKSDAYRMLGLVYRATGRPVLAEARFNAAIELARKTGAVLSEAEATRELAVLCQELNQNQRALTNLIAAHRLFAQLNASRDAVNVKRKRAQLEETYLQTLKSWGQSIESADFYTYGHCDRVATWALMIARELGLSEEAQTTIRLGAYLHDVGKIKVPHEVLNKPGRLTDAEFAVIKQHPVWGVELLDGIDFPWDIKPIVRWHHERLDGTGYPDALRGDEFPLNAQVVGMADVFDALTSDRSYRQALGRTDALRIMTESRHHWREDVFAAFVRAFGSEAAFTDLAAIAEDIDRPERTERHALSNQ
jgi:putative nucleotidyltransferase with HDIG domain